MNLIQIWVVTWSYSDRSGFGIVRAYENPRDAEEDLAMLEEIASDKEFKLEETLIVRGGEE